MSSHVTPGVRYQNFVVLTLNRAPVVLRTISNGVGNFCAVKCLKHNLETLHFTFFAKNPETLKFYLHASVVNEQLLGTIAGAESILEMLTSGLSEIFKY